MARLIPIEYIDFRRGLNDSSIPDVVDDRELMEALNCDLSDRGGFATRKGTVKHATISSSPVSRLFVFGRQDGNIPLAVTDKKLVKWDGTVVYSELSSDNIDWTIHDGKLYIVDGAKYLVYDGETCEEVTPHTPDAGELQADLTGVKRCKYILQRNNQFFAAGDVENPNTIYYSELTYPNYFKATSQIRAISDDDDVIVGLAEFHKAMVVFKQRHIYAWFGMDPKDPNMRFDRINVHNGTVSQRTVARAENYLLYLAEDGVYALLGLEENYISSVNVSKNITRTIERLTNLENACAIYHKGKYYCAVCDDGTGINNKVLVGHVTMMYIDEYGQIHIPWTIYDGWNVASWAVKDGELYYGDAVTGDIYQAEVGYNDDGKPIHFRVKTKPFDLHQKFILKKFKSLLLAFKQYDVERSQVNVRVKIDYSERDYALNVDESLIWGEGLWGFSYWGWSDLVTKEIKLRDRGHRIQLTFENNTVDTPVTIYGIGITAKFKRARGNKLGVEGI